MQTATLLPWLLAAVLTTAAVLGAVALARVIRADGYGRAPAPRSRPDWGSDALPSRPYAAWH